MKLMHVIKTGMQLSLPYKHMHRSIGITTVLSLGIFFLSVQPVAASWVDDYLAGFIYETAKAFGGFFLGMGGLLLDTTIKYLIVGMGDFFAEDGGGLGIAVNEFWTIIRDVLNIFFIFGLIYIGIKTILNSQDSGTRKMLGSLIAAALLINFSLYISQAVVDFSNIASIQIYQQIISGVSGAYSDSYVIGGRDSIAGAFFEVSEITSWFGAEKPEEGATILVFSLMMMLFFIVTGIFFALGAILVISRFIVLVLCMIFSPILFLGWVIPSLKGFSSKWTKIFFKNCFFGPAYLFMLYLSLYSMQLLTSHVGTGTSNFGEMFEGGGMDMGVVEIVMYFIVMLGFLYASIKVGQSMSVAGAGGVARFGSGLRKGAQGALYRNTAGRGLNRFGVGMFDRLDKAAESGSRSARIGRTLLGGEAGRRAVVKARDYGAGGTGYSDQEKMDTERKIRANENLATDRRRSAIDAGSKEGLALDAKERIAMERSVQNSSPAQIVAMMKNDKDRARVMAVAGELNENQVKAVMEDKEIDVGTKTQLAAKRGEQVEKRLREQEEKETLKEVIGKADTAQLKAMGFDKVYENAEYLSAKQIEEWKDLTPTEKTRLKNRRKEGLIALQKKEGTKAVFDRFTDETERSKLPKEVLLDYTSIPNLNPKVLEKIISNDGINETERANIKENVRKYYGTDAVHKDEKKFKQFERWFDTPGGQRF